VTAATSAHELDEDPIVESRSSRDDSPMRGCSVLVVVVLASCTYKPAPGEAIGDVCKIENNMKDVVVAGYLNAPVIMFPCTTSCSLELVSNTSERYGVSLSFDVGTAPLTMKPVKPAHELTFPGQVERISPSALRVIGSDGTVYGPGDVVRVKGQLSASPVNAGTYCSLVPKELVAVH
jgi:hypothetical protein